MLQKANTFYYSVLFFLGVVSSYGLTAFILKIYGSEALGLFSTITNLLILFEILALGGMNLSIIKFVTEDLAKNRSETKTLYYFSLKKMILPSLLLGLLLFLSSDFIANYLFENKLYSPALKMLSLILPVAVIKHFNQEFLRANNYFKVSEFMRRFGLTSLTILLIILSKNLIIDLTVLNSYFFSIAILTLCGSILVVYILKPFHKNALDSSYKTHYNWTSKALLVSLFIMTMTSQISIYIIEIFADTKDVGIFHFYLRLSAIISFPFLIASNLFGPRISPLIKNKKFNKLQSEINQFIFYSLSSTIFLMLLVFIFHLRVFSYLSEDLTTYKNAFYILVLSKLLIVLFGPHILILQLGTQQKILIKNSFIGLLITLFSNLILVKNYGIYGAGWGVFFGSLSICLLNTVSVFRKYNIKTFINPFLFIRN